MTVELIKMVQHPELGMPSEMGMVIGGSGNNEVNWGSYTCKGPQTPWKPWLVLQTGHHKSGAWWWESNIDWEAHTMEAWAYTLSSCNVVIRLHQ